MSDDDEQRGKAPAAFAAGIAARLTAALAGKDAPALPLPRREEVRDMLAADPTDDAARAAVLAYGHDAVLDAHVAAAAAEDRAEIVLKDGAKFDRPAAERMLAAKEERRAYTPMREAMDEALAAARGLRFDDLGNVFDEAVGAPPGFDIAGAAEAAAALQAVLAATVDACGAAREALASLGGAPLQGVHGLARGLDLPDPNGAFHDGVVVGLARAVRAAGARHEARPLKRVAVPRAFAALVVDGAPDAVRVGATPAARAGRFLVSLEGFGAGLAASWQGGSASVSADVATRALGAALAFGSASAPVRRALLGESRAQADRAGRIAAATWLLAARARAAIARTLLLGEGHPDALREALLSAYGEDAGHAAAVAANLPPLPGRAVLRSRASSALADARALLDGAALALRLRADHDHAFPQRGEVAAQQAHAAVLWSDGAPPLAPWGAEPGTAADLLAWFGEAL